MELETREQDIIQKNVVTRYEQVRDTLFDILGGPIDDFETERRSPVPTYRAMVITVLRAEGFTLTAIGAAAGKTHAMIFDYLRRLNDIVEHPMEADAPLLNTWSKLQKAILDKKVTPKGKRHFLYTTLAAVKDECNRTGYDFIIEVSRALYTLLETLRKVSDKLPKR